MVRRHQLLVQLDDGVKAVAQRADRVVVAVMLHGAGDMASGDHSE